MKIALLSVVLIFTGRGFLLTRDHMACSYWTPSKDLVIMIVDGTACPKELVIK